jgi:SAM-dependent methyltransferase
MQKLPTAQPWSIEGDPFFAQDLLQMAGAPRYRRWQFEMIRPYLAGRILEVGGGIGNFTPCLASVAHSVVSVEPNSFCHKQLAEQTKSLANVSVYNTTAEALDHQLPPDYQADAVVCMNVLEHLQDDEAAVRIFSARLKPGGSLVLLIPAMPSLFGEIDRRLGHYRRYSKGTVRALLRKTSFTVLKLRYFNFIGALGWWWNARITKRLTQSDSQIHLFDHYIVPWASRLEAMCPPPVGQSLLVVAQKHPH